MAAPMSDHGVVKAVAAKVARFVADGDLDGLRALYMPDARIWHNTDDREKTVEESLAFLDGLLSVTSRRWYADVRLTPTPIGYIDQHYMCAMLTTGEEVRVPICMVVTLDGERVKRLEEYIESEASGPVTAALLRGG
jgi:ketosteroid isomerase-like protein